MTRSGVVHVLAFAKKQIAQQMIQMEVEVESSGLDFIYLI
jgi:hypothetical protein